MNTNTAKQIKSRLGYMEPISKIISAFSDLESMIKIDCQGEYIDDIIEMLSTDLQELGIVDYREQVDIIKIIRRG
jgi:hypothetical protein